tara:strand:- start:260 stop:385 length:126 start_codon:yes stop_codon:yes gene_type:complete
MQEPDEKKKKIPLPPTDDATGIFEYPDEELKDLYTNHEEGS